MFKKLQLLTIISFSCVLISCFTYGSPDSVFVNFVGRDLENFVDYIITDESMHKSARKVPIHMGNKAVTGKGAEVEKERLS
jgi:hypothetical protein